jgi:hypothetical protein
MPGAFKWMVDTNTGFETESDYGYESGNGRVPQCTADKKKEKVLREL